MKDEKVVRNYGLHWDDSGVAYLHQGRGAANFVGLHARSPYKVVPGQAKMCNHAINAAAPLPDPLQWEAFARYLEDPLVLAMLPMPKAKTDSGVYFLADPQDELGLKLILLSKLSSPILPAVRPISTIPARTIKDLTGNTNIQPLVLTSATTRDQRLIDDLTTMAPDAPRTVIITGDPDITASPPMKTLATDLWEADERDLASLPLENIGAHILRRFARREDPLAPLERRFKPAVKDRDA